MDTDRCGKMEMVEMIQQVVFRFQFHFYTYKNPIIYAKIAGVWKWGTEIRDDVKSLQLRG